jgi:hypothetical protein
MLLTYQVIRDKYTLCLSTDMPVCESIFYGDIMAEEVTKWYLQMIEQLLINDK